MLLPDHLVPPCPLRLVLVDTRAERRHLMRQMVEGGQDETSVVAEADSRDAALFLVAEQRADAVVVDIHMPVAEGLKTIRDLRRSYPQLGIVVCSFGLGPAIEREAIVEGAHACLAKPASRHKLRGVLEKACSHQQSSVDRVPVASA